MKKWRRKSALGRSANKADRKYAQGLAELVRAALDSPNHEVCLNPEDEWEERTWWNLELLISDLERFAQTGRFDEGENLMVRNVIICLDFREIKKKGKSSTEAFGQLAEKYELDEKTLQRIIYWKPKKVQATD